MPSNPHQTRKMVSCGQRLIFITPEILQAKPDTGLMSNPVN